MKKLRGYIFARSFMGERAPQHVQNIILRDYCTKKGYELLLAATEYAMPDSFMILESVLDDLASVDGVVFYSLYQLPTQPVQRKSVYSRALAAGKSLHFAVEGMSIAKQQDVDSVEQCLLVKATLDHCVTQVEG
ncbi:MAG: sporadic carbohydrate cluster protein, LIC12192 family [Actinobacteria bacterium]|jgi:sporadic carbohydrate cluster protein (TIGR04323 family)|nr:sporadic carbohydrate cluster protein, LIC12192 family [Actinomycetota bacterium]NCW83310.1 sporadic carbohydrate cluster protein, LIC12192 family [Acidimicrobiia bacterium]NBP41428.1 sporadic carbohydrate cluster protein, LIC12192 family [Actinomycetota bacterium]NBQ03945.1 sporadic carbohydrate cluster protein, LIC12192 family [Actinomycetota bacterium]NBY61915.1 sporadic carbohydrate cluster protein, LIC12192 family [Actinomycetota bacterium]